MNMPLIIICACLQLAYVVLVLVYKLGWAMQKEFILPQGYQPHTFISVIVPARNESKSIVACISSILAQDYPRGLFEIIVVDDYSTDGTADIVERFNNEHVHCIRLADHLDAGAKLIAYKKAAIAAGIANSKGSLIVTTDADCVAPPKWLTYIAAISEQEQAAMIVAPVVYVAESSVLQVFQLIDFMSMQGITAAAHRLRLGNMSNGANLAFSKKTYEAVGGYEGVDHMASGDDLLLMVKINKAKAGKVVYLKSQEAIVRTAPQSDWKSFFRQRIRWASKSGKYGDTRLTLILVLVYLFNLSFLVAVIAGIFNPVFFYVFCAMLLVKMVVEFDFLIPVAKFYDRSWALSYLFLLQPLHILYIIVSGFLGFIGGYEWKGRRVK